MHLPGFLRAATEKKEKVMAVDEATARAYLTSYDLCAKWGDEETKQPVRKSISASGRPGVLARGL